MSVVRPEANAETSFTFNPPAAKRRRKRNRRLREDFTVEPVMFSGLKEGFKKARESVSEGYNVVKKKASTAAEKAKKVYAAAKKAARGESDSD